MAPSTTDLKANECIYTIDREEDLYLHIQLIEYDVRNTRFYMTRRNVLIVSFSLFLCVFALYAQDTGLSLTNNNLTLHELFRQIQAQTDYNIGHSNRINTNITVELDQQSGDVIQIISQALKATPYT